MAATCKHLAVTGTQAMHPMMPSSQCGDALNSSRSKHTPPFQSETALPHRGRHRQP
ncbi:hypothetical protein AF72_00670 [Xylella taiwanensis]|uniref:Uncharacterized protein n=1 Tax=Xylella taiwanensis TaxID=1444770 RepID=Z9JN73_9GAMM|nr:hypothetical protein AF72_00670 [Xylella taiwanensis]